MGIETKKVCILDYGSGNVKSVFNMFNTFECVVNISNSIILSGESISKYFLSTLVITKPFFQLFHHQIDGNADAELLDHRNHLY